MRRLLRDLFYGALHAARCTGWARHRRGLHVPVLFYHGVSAERVGGVMNCEKKHVYAGDFEKHLSFLKRFYNPVPLSEYAAALRSGVPMRPHSVVVTFDDGYENNYRAAFPLLKKYGVPATLYLATEFVESGEMLWFDRLACAFAATKAQRFESPVESGSWPLRGEAEMTACYLRTKKRLKALPDARRREILDKICRELLGAQRPDAPALFAPLKKEQIREMVRSGLIDIGSHSLGHPILTAVSAQEARAEIAESKKRASGLSGLEAQSFSYPNGAYSAELMRLVEEAGYDSAVAVGLRVNPPAGVSPYAIDRVALAEGDTTAVIASTLCGIREKFIAG